jgi:DNA-binding response OmpR family regulator
MIRLLLVEDNPAQAALVQALLRETPALDLEVGHAQTLAAALALLAQGGFDVALLDLGLPDSQGLETFSTLHERFPALPVLILTGRSDEELGMVAVQGGAQDYLMKSEVEGPALARSLRYAMERSRLLRALERAATEIRDLQLLLPICASCKKIRDDQGHWEQLEAHLSRVAHLGFTHGICPECCQRTLAELSPVPGPPGPPPGHP